MIIPCCYCGTPFKAKPYDIKVRGKKYCSIPCCSASRIRIIEERFWDRIVRGKEENDCWEWKGARTKAGYGSLSKKREDGEYGPSYAHILSWEIHFGPIPKGIEVCHHCDNPPCCNPKHLFLGTHKDNMLDALKKGRLDIKSMIKHGEEHHQAKLTEFQVREILMSKEKGATLGRLYNVNRHLIYYIRARKIWKHIQP